MKKRTEWIIQDWAGNHKFPLKTFKSFESGWAFLEAQFDTDEDLGEFYVVEKEVE